MTLDLSTDYLGLKLKSPLVAGASPLSEKLDGVKRLEDAGASAVVMFSLFEEQLAGEENVIDHFLTYGTESFAEARSYFPAIGEYMLGPDAYLELIRKAKETVKIPVIGSLNGVSTGGWIDFAGKIQDAGADALELNIYYLPTGPVLRGEEVDKMYVEVVEAVVKRVSIPVTVKIGPFLSAPANLCSRLVKAGAKGLVLFNRFYQPDFDLEKLTVESTLRLSRSTELLLSLRWIAILHGRLQADFAVSTGVHTAEDVLKSMMAGANVTYLVSVLLREGAERLGVIEREMKKWMEEHEYASVRQMQGSLSQKNVAEPAAFARANYMKMLQSWRPDPSVKF